MYSRCNAISNRALSKCFWFSLLHNMKLSLSFSDHRCAVHVFYRFWLPDDFHETIWIHRSYFDSFGKTFISFPFFFFLWFLFLFWYDPIAQCKCYLYSFNLNKFFFFPQYAKMVSSLLFLLV
jgi:hypothetical protein